MSVSAGKTLRRCLCALLALLLLTVPPVQARAETLIEQPLLENLLLSVDGAEPKPVRTLHYGYGNNRYVSMRDVAAALGGTPRRFNVSISGNQIVMTSGADYTPAGGENQAFPDRNPNTGGLYVYTTQPLALNPIQLDGRELRYLSFLGTNAASRQDCFISLTDLAMQLDLELSVSAAGMAVNTAGHFSIDLETLESEGFYYEVHSALLGDAATGEIYAAWMPELPVPIASTSKLMTFVVVMDALRDGQISLADAVTIPEEAARLSRTPDGMIYMQAGQQSSVPDLLCGMLLPSSNECALALAVHTAGSEEAFVARMNRKAQALGLSDSTVFYNCNGLPVYTDNLTATKVQNRMSALDMFKLVTYLLETYPEVTDITSMKSAVLESLDATVLNSNPLLYNLPGVVGLKTGTTNMSGACLVTLLETEDASGQPHALVAVEFGAEDSSVRTTLSEELLRYGLQRLGASAAPRPSPAPAIPRSAEELIRLALRAL